MSFQQVNVHPDYLQRQLRLAAAIQQYFGPLLEQNQSRTRGLHRCLDRLTSAVARLQSARTVAALSAVQECHNELCVVEELLRSVDPGFSLVEYEPSLPAGQRRIDLRATYPGGVSFVEVKTIQPELADRWDQYERVVEAGHITENVTIHFERNWMGGELWHQKFTARSKMLEYALDFESRIDSGGIEPSDSLFVLAFFSDGFALHQDELEDFVAFYGTGQHRLDDGLAKMEQHWVAGKTLSRRISTFAYFCRPACESRPTAINWNVRPPSEPWACK